MADALLVTSSFLPGRGGIESYLAELCEALAPRLAVFAHATRDGRPMPAGLPYSTFPYQGHLLWPSRRIEAAIDNAARETGTRTLLFGTPWPLALLGPRLARRGYRYAVIAHGAETLIPSSVPVVRRRLATALATADALFAVSDYTAGKLDALLSSTRARIPPIERLYARVDTDRFSPAVDGASFRREAAIPEEARVILCLGRLVRRKGIHRILAAWDDLVARCPQAHLMVAGTGPAERSLRRQAARTGARVSFLGRVPEDRAAACYAACDVFALPVADRWFGLEVEGLGVVLLEAAASGKPCVTGCSGGTPEAVIDGQTGFVVDATDRRRLVDALARLLTDGELAGRMGAAGRRHVEQNFAGTEPPAALRAWLG